MAAAFGLALAAVPFFLYLGGTLSLKWLVIIFLGGTGLYLAISFGAVFYYHVIRGIPAPWEEAFINPKESPSTSQGNS
jgi:hypothetical protein